MTRQITWFTYGTMPPATEAAILEALDAYEAVIDVEFVRQPSSGEIGIAESDQWGSSAATLGLPSTVYLLPGEDGHWALHEIGHSLGMRHPHEVGRPDIGMTESIMSYNWNTYSATLGEWLIPKGLMAWDVAQLVPIYGASHQNDGPTTWVPDPLVLDSIIDFDGIDTLDLRRSAGAEVDLAAGWVHHGQGGSTWVLPESIEVVKLSPGADEVWLNTDAVIYGLGKNDTLFADDGEARKLGKREARDLGVKGKAFEIDDAVVMWKGGEKALEALVVEA